MSRWDTSSGHAIPKKENQMIVTTKEMLLDAQAGHYAVGAFND